MYSVFLSWYRSTHESLGELEKAVETLTCSSCSHSISCSAKLPPVFQLDTNTVHVFYFLNIVVNVFYAAATSMKWIEAKMKVRALFYATLLNKYTCNTAAVVLLVWLLSGHQSTDSPSAWVSKL